jgi:hypothetical protein
MIKKIARWFIITVGLVIILISILAINLAGVPIWIGISFWGILALGTVLGEVFKSGRTA